MLPYRFIQISATVVSAIALAAIALSLCPLKQQINAFNECVAEVISQGEKNSQAVRHCNGGVAKLQHKHLEKRGLTSPLFNVGEKFY